MRCGGLWSFSILDACTLCVHDLFFFFFFSITTDSLQTMGMLRGFILYICDMGYKHLFQLTCALPN